MSEAQGDPRCQHEMTAEYVKVRLNDGYFCEKCGMCMTFVPAALLERAEAALEQMLAYVRAWHPDTGEGCSVEEAMASTDALLSDLRATREGK